MRQKGVRTIQVKQEMQQTSIAQVAFGMFDNSFGGIFFERRNMAP